MKNYWIANFNKIVFAAMIIYLFVRIVMWETSVGINSAPSWVVLFESVYFLTPMAVVDGIWLICRWLRK